MPFPPVYWAKLSREAWKLILSDSAEERISWKKFGLLEEGELSVATETTIEQKLSDTIKETSSGTTLISFRKKM